MIVFLQTLLFFIRIIHYISFEVFLFLLSEFIPTSLFHLNRKFSFPLLIAQTFNEQTSSNLIVSRMFFKALPIAI
jgi:hypothetical protein